VVLLGFSPVHAANKLGEIDFFGYKGLDLKKVRNALPVKEGDEYLDRMKGRVRAAVIAAIGVEPTDISSKCCDNAGNRLLYIGLPGASYKPFSFNPAPTGTERLPADIMDLSKRVDEAGRAAVYKGAAGEDDSKGYALSDDPTARALQLELHEWAIHHERELLQALESSAAAQDRRVAASAVGYIHQSPEQIKALVRASRDLDETVRDLATRALGVLAQSNTELAATIPPDTFIDMLNSGTWTDRNKGIWVLDELTKPRDAKLLARIRSAALDSLIEMASWHWTGHASSARMVLGRIAGIPEDRLIELAFQGSAGPIIEAAGGH
jgi:hypothetical protein